MQERHRSLPFLLRGGIEHCSINLGILQLGPPSREKCGGVFILLLIVWDLKQTLCMVWEELV